MTSFNTLEKVIAYRYLHEYANIITTPSYLRRILIYIYINMSFITDTDAGQLFITS